MIDYIGFCIYTFAYMSMFVYADWMNDGVSL